MTYQEKHMIKFRFDIDLKINKYTTNLGLLNDQTCNRGLILEKRDKLKYNVKTIIKTHYIHLNFQ